MTILPTIASYLLRLLIAVAIFAFFRLASWILPRLFRRYKQQEWIRRHLPLIEAAAWVIFVISFIHSLIKPYPITGITFVIIMVALSWRFLRDWISGLFIKVDNNFRPNQRIRVQNHDGVIKELGLLSAEIEIGKGEVLVYPYSKLEKEAIIKRTPSEKIRSHAIELVLNPEIRMGEAHTKIKHTVLSLPWAVPSRAPFVELIDKQNGGNFYRVVLYSTAPKYFPLMEEQLRKALEK